MSMKIPLLYLNSDVFKLDLEIYGTKASVPSRTLDELKRDMWEDFKMTHPKPTLEAQRYKLSDKVSDDYEVKKLSEDALDLQSGEMLFDLTQISNISEVFELQEDVPQGVKSQFVYENAMTENKLEDFLKVRMDDYKGNRDIQGSISKDNSVKLSDNDVENYQGAMLGDMDLIDTGIDDGLSFSLDDGVSFEEDNDDEFVYNEESNNIAEEVKEEKKVGFSVQYLDIDASKALYKQFLFGGTSKKKVVKKEHFKEEGVDYGILYHDLSLDVEDSVEEVSSSDFIEESFYDYDLADDILDFQESDYDDEVVEEVVEEYEDDYEDEEFEDDDYEEVIETRLDEDDAESSDFTEDSFYDEDFFEMILSYDESDYEEEYEVVEEVVEDYEDDYNDDDYEDEEIIETRLDSSEEDLEEEEEEEYEDEIIEYNTFSEEEFTDKLLVETIKDGNLYNELLEAQLELKREKQEKESNVEESKSVSDYELDKMLVSDNVVSDDKQSSANSEQKEVTVVEEEPKDIRQFLRKHPRCEVSFALQYFSKKELEKAIMLGKVIKRGNKLHI